ncbi:MFS transporter [Demequina litorisediminis]|uniref:Major facilitator superfamily (MFS) profile domain-containing protein n=1 Tax=Demequina litorisediminis TaxID=1849022 RepID=A0ABQ6IF05_9MICO|nr:MFS transporter [Demequina litorisediminis]GMA36311.1 hypothetical protein GCM10025876_25150 [Demequina litorisediminis]
MPPPSSCWRGAVITSLPCSTFTRSLGPYAPWQANLLLGLYVIGLVPGLLVAAALSDRLGRKPLMLAGLAAGTIGSLILAAGLHHLALLALGRAFAGIGVGIAMSVGASLDRGACLRRATTPMPALVRAPGAAP